MKLGGGGVGAGKRKRGRREDETTTRVFYPGGEGGLMESGCSEPVRDVGVFVI